MKICLVTDGITPYVVGGMQRHSRMLAEALSALGHDVTVFHTASVSVENDINRGAISDALSSVGSVDEVLIKMPSAGRFPGHYVRQRIAYSRRILECFMERGEKSDFIYAQGFTGWAFVEAKAQSSELPPVGVNLHGYEMYQRVAGTKSYLKNIPLRMAASKLSRNADVVFSFSGKIRDIVEHRLQVPAERIISLPNAIHQSWLVNEPKPKTGKRRFLFIGRWERRKGVAELTVALARLARVDFEMHFVGPIPKREQLQDERMIYHGQIANERSLKNIIDKCDVLVSPSFSEGMPTVILEAMARGLAILATDVGANREVVDSQNGILIERPSIDLLMTALLQACKWDQCQLDQRKKESLRRARSYAWEVVAQRTVQEVRNFLARTDLPKEKAI